MITMRGCLRFGDGRQIGKLFLKSYIFVKLPCKFHHRVGTPILVAEVHDDACGSTAYIIVSIVPHAYIYVTLTAPRQSIASRDSR